MSESEAGTGHLQAGQELAFVRISALLDNAQGLARYQGVDTITDQAMTLEVLNTAGLRAADIAALIQRLQALVEFDHPSVLSPIRLDSGEDWLAAVVPAPQAVSLEALAIAPPGPDGVSIAILAELQDALAALHDRDLVHGCICPDSLSLGEDGKHRLHYSLLHLVRGRSETGQACAALEESETAFGKLGAASDIYSLSASLYRLVCRQPPVAAKERLQAIHRGTADPLVRASDVAPEGASELMLDWLDAGLALKPDQRPQSVDDWRAVSTEVELPPISSRWWIPALSLAVVMLIAIILGIASR